MSKEDDKWIKNLRNRLEDYSEPLPEGLWEQLEDELPRPRVIPLWKRWGSVAAAAVVVLAVSSLVFWKTNAPTSRSFDIQEANRVAEQLANERLDEPVRVLEAPEAERVAERREVSAASDKLRMVDTDRVLPMEYRDLAAADVPAEQEIPAEEHEVMTAQVAEHSAPSSSPYSSMKASRAAERKIWQQNAEEAGFLKQSNRAKVQIGLLSGGMPYASTKEFRGMSRFTSKYSVARSHQPVMDGMNNHSAYNQVLFNNQHADARTQVKHRLPVMVGASVKWYFSKNWALESGLSYTYLQSDLHSGSNLYLEDRQKLHYIGIPLKLHRTIWNNSRLAVYASAGGMVEKCVSGTLESAYVTGFGETETESVSLKVHPLQCSVMASVGTQLNFTRWLSLFVEPGMAYFFDDGSKVETIRKEHPFNFDLRFGVRFDISK